MTDSADPKVADEAVQPAEPAAEPAEQPTLDASVAEQKVADEAKQAAQDEETVAVNSVLPDGVTIVPGAEGKPVKLHVAGSVEERLARIEKSLNLRSPADLYAQAVDILQKRAVAGPVEVEPYKEGE